MGIKRSKDSSIEKKSLPGKLAAFCKQAFTSDAMAKFFEAKAKAGKDGIKSYLENNDDGFEIDLTVAKSFDCDEGKITYATRKRYDYDADKLIKLVESGAINIATLINCISTLKDANLKTAIGSSIFDTVATEGYTEFLQLKASPEFKKKIEDIVGSERPKAEQAEKKTEKKKEEKKEEKKTLSLDDILEGKP